MALVYSCCFWFSLRLGGILIGIYSTGLLVLILDCLCYADLEKFKTMLTELTEDMELIYIKEYIENVKNDPETFFNLSIAVLSIYLIVCIIFIYGAYTCNNMLMTPYLILDLTRLIIQSISVATALLILKQNTMDIGLLIGASVAGGFFLLGEFYLWVCAANLPILINEMERDEQAATIDKLQQLLHINNQRTHTNTLDSVPLATDYGNNFRSDVFVTPRNQTIDRLTNRAKISTSFANSYNIPHR